VGPAGPAGPAGPMTKYGKDFEVPKDFPSVLKAFTREVLRSQPANVYEFGAAYFSQLLQEVVASGTADGASSARLTPAQMEQMLIQLFRDADVDGSNSLSLGEFKEIIRLANLGLSADDVSRLMAEADVNADGQIDYAEFVPLAVELVQGMYAKIDMRSTQDAQEERARIAASDYMLHGMSKDSLNAVILDVFKKSDKDNSGTLTIAEFHNCIREADLGLTRKEVNVLMHSVDVDMSGTITYEEFAPLCFDILVEILKDELLQAQRSSSDVEKLLLGQFATFDPAATGFLKAGELRDALRAADLGLTRLQVLTVVSESGEDESGNVDYAAFAPKAAQMVYLLLDVGAQREREQAVARLLASDVQHALVHGHSTEQVQQVLLSAVGAADPAGSGMIDVATLKQALETCPLGLAPQEVKSLLAAVDVDGGGSVAYMPLVDAAFDILRHLSHEKSYKNLL